ncbi:MAG: septal ring lytic transglycosylase RlpA family protein [Ignavibacteriota bacterium]
MSTSGTFPLVLVGFVLILFASGCGSPLLKAGATQEGLASYYGKEFEGRKTSSGEVFRPNELTAAHRTYPFGTILRVTNLVNDQKVEVRVNDRGPVKPERIIDLSYGAAKIIGLDRSGLIRVRLEVLEWGKPKSK